MKNFFRTYNAHIAAAILAALLAGLLWYASLIEKHIKREAASLTTLSGWSFVYSVYATNT